MAKPNNLAEQKGQSVKEQNKSRREAVKRAKRDFYENRKDFYKNRMAYLEYRKASSIADQSTNTRAHGNSRIPLLTAYLDEKEKKRELNPELAVEAIKIRHAAEVYYNKKNIVYRLAQSRFPRVGPGRKDYDRWNKMSAEDLIAEVKAHPKRFNRTTLTNCAVHRFIRSLNFDIDAYDRGIKSAGYREGVHSVLGRIVLLAFSLTTFGITEGVKMAAELEKTVKFLGHFLPAAVIAPQVTGRYRINTDIKERTLRKGGSSVLAPNIQKARFMAQNYKELKKLNEKLGELQLKISRHINARPRRPVPEEIFNELQEALNAGKIESKKYKETANWNKTNTWSKGYGGMVSVISALGIVMTLKMPVVGLPILAACIPAQWFAGMADEKNKHQYNFRANLESGDILTDEGKFVSIDDLTAEHINQNALRSLQKPFASDMVDLIREIYQNELGQLKRKMRKREEKIIKLKASSVSSANNKKIESFQKEVDSLQGLFDEILNDVGKFESFDPEEWLSLNPDKLIGKCLDRTKYLRKMGIKAANNRAGEKEAQILQRYFQAFAGFASLGITTPIADVISFIDAIPDRTSTPISLTVQAVGGTINTLVTGEVRTQKAYNKSKLAKAREHVADVKAKLNAEKDLWRFTVDIPGQQGKQYELDLTKTGGFDKYFHIQRQRLWRAAGIILPNLLSPPRGLWNALKTRSLLKEVKLRMAEITYMLNLASNLEAPTNEDGKAQRKETFAALTEQILGYRFDSKVEAGTEPLVVRPTLKSIREAAKRVRRQYYEHRRYAKRPVVDANLTSLASQKGEQESMSLPLAPLKLPGTPPSISGEQQEGLELTKKLGAEAQISGKKSGVSIGANEKETDQKKESAKQEITIPWHQGTLASLAPGKWVDDRAIQIAYEQLAAIHQESTEIHFELPSTTAMRAHGEGQLDIPEKAKLVFFPINNTRVIARTALLETMNAGSHWTLLVYDRRERGAPGFHYYDSLNRSEIDDNAKQLANEILRSVPPTQTAGANIKKHKAPRQNAADCGIYAIECSRVLAEKYSEDNSFRIGDIKKEQVQAPNEVRKQLLAVIKAAPPKSGEELWRSEESFLQDRRAIAETLNITTNVIDIKKPARSFQGEVVRVADGIVYLKPTEVEVRNIGAFDVTNQIPIFRIDISEVHGEDKLRSAAIGQRFSITIPATGHDGPIRAESEQSFAQRQMPPLGSEVAIDEGEGSESRGNSLFKKEEKQELELELKQLEPRVEEHGQRIQQIEQSLETLEQTLQQLQASVKQLLEQEQMPDMQGALHAEAGGENLRNIFNTYYNQYLESFDPQKIISEELFKLLDNNSDAMFNEFKNWFNEKHFLPEGNPNMTGILIPDEIIQFYEDVHYHHYKEDLAVNSSGRFFIPSDKDQQSTTLLSINNRSSTALSKSVLEEPSGTMESEFIDTSVGSPSGGRKQEQQMPSPSGTTSVPSSAKVEAKGVYSLPFMGMKTTESSPIPRPLSETQKKLLELTDKLNLEGSPSSDKETDTPPEIKDKAEIPEPAASTKKAPSRELITADIKNMLLHDGTSSDSDRQRTQSWQELHLNDISQDTFNKNILDALSKAETLKLSFEPDEDGHDLVILRYDSRMIETTLQRDKPSDFMASMDEMIQGRSDYTPGKKAELSQAIKTALEEAWRERVRDVAGALDSKHIDDKFVDDFIETQKNLHLLDRRLAMSCKLLEREMSQYLISVKGTSIPSASKIYRHGGTGVAMEPEHLYSYILKGPRKLVSYAIKLPGQFWPGEKTAIDNNFPGKKVISSPKLLNKKASIDENWITAGQRRNGDIIFVDESDKSHTKVAILPARLVKQQYVLGEKANFCEVAVINHYQEQVLRQGLRSLGKKLETKVFEDFKQYLKDNDIRQRRNIDPATFQQRCNEFFDSNKINALPNLVDSLHEKRVEAEPLRTEEKDAFMNNFIELAVKSETESFQLRLNNFSIGSVNRISLSLIDKDNKGTHILLPFPEYNNFLKDINKKITRLPSANMDKVSVTEKVDAEIRKASVDANLPPPEGHFLSTLFAKEDRDQQDIKILLDRKTLRGLTNDDQEKKLLAHIREQSESDHITNVTFVKLPANGEITGKRIFIDTETRLHYLWKSREGEQQRAARILAVPENLMEKAVKNPRNDGSLTVMIPADEKTAQIIKKRK